jgi:NadR type nicotinamide-nucleotide adenylyltransferase
VIKKIVVYGPESTGKTELAQQLAQYFATVWSPEFARPYLLYRNTFNPLPELAISQAEDLAPLAIGQVAMEQHIATLASRYLICDTNLLTNLVYGQYYFNTHPHWLPDLIRAQHYNFYLLLSTDIPWEADALRDRPNERENLYNLFKSYLEYFGCAYTCVSGLGKLRFHNALNAIKQWEEKESK